MKTLIVALLIMLSTGCTGTNWLDTRSVHAPLDRPASMPLPSGQSPSICGSSRSSSSRAENAARTRTTSEAVWNRCG